MSSHPPHLFHLIGSVGTCGTNNPNDVKAIQTMLDQAGYNLATGRTIHINGKCDALTSEAIIWYQRLLDMSPSGLVRPVDTWFLEALSNAYSPYWKPRHIAGPLTVPEGQFTFDNEGVDYITAVVPFRQPSLKNFTRILHHPPGISGVTLGRGFDMKLRSAGVIFSTLRQVGLPEYKAVLCSKASGISGRNADNFVKVFGPLVGEITHRQQIDLFTIVYREYKSTAQRIYNHFSARISGSVIWEHLDSRIKDVFIDTLYQGNQTARQFVQAAAHNNRNEVIKYIKTDPVCMSFESHRKRIMHLS